MLWIELFRFPPDFSAPTLELALEFDALSGWLTGLTLELVFEFSYF